MMQPYSKKAPALVRDETIKAENLAALVSKIAPANEHSAYISTLRNYPEDLICAAYVHLNNNRNIFLSLPAMVAFIEPQLRCRKHISSR